MLFKSNRKFSLFVFFKAISIGISIIYVKVSHSWFLLPSQFYESLVTHCELLHTHFLYPYHLWRFTHLSGIWWLIEEFIYSFTSSKLSVLDGFFEFVVVVYFPSYDNIRFSLTYRKLNLIYFSIFSC